MNNKQDIRDRVKTYEDACRVLGIDNKTPELPNIPERDRRGVTAYYKLIIIARALNEGWEPDWKDREQDKVVPYFHFDRENNTTAGFAYALTDNAPSSTDASLGSRLCFKNETLAEYAATQFEELWRDYILYPNDVTEPEKGPQENAEDPEEEEPSVADFLLFSENSRRELERKCRRFEGDACYMTLACAKGEDGAEAAAGFGGNPKMMGRLLAEIFSQQDLREVFMAMLHYMDVKKEAARMGKTTVEIRHD